MKHVKFACALLFRGIVDNIPSSDDIWEEKILLIFANDEQDAIIRAVQEGAKHQIEYQNNEAKNVKLTFVGVVDAFELHDELINGGELFARHWENSQVEFLLKGLKAKK